MKNLDEIEADLEGIRDALDSSSNYDRRIVNDLAKALQELVSYISTAEDYNRGAIESIRETIANNQRG